MALPGAISQIVQWLRQVSDICTPHSTILTQPARQEHLSLEAPVSEEPLWNHLLSSVGAMRTCPLTLFTPSET